MTLFPLTDGARKTLHMQTVKFWFVWTKKGNKPRRMHDSCASAEQEAIRLAALCPGQKFIVLEAMTKFHTELEAPVAAEAEIAESAA